ncbi:MAG: CPBP family intramembrane metalloprotease [Clostridiaceae bacterium]|jgi:membrane protease YdiL (CAAX protease family)|nr:CPBP family intramembrane metalloprotease [Clostridiaceae bacterium]
MARASMMIVLFYLMQYSGRGLLLEYGIVSAPWASFIVYAILFLAGILLYGKQLVTEWSRFRKRKKKIWNFLLEVLLWSLLSVAITVALYFSIMGIFNVSILPSGQSAVRQAINSLPAIPALLLIAVSLPFVQELTFRESIIGVSERTRKFRLFMASLVSVAAFVLIQTNNLWEICYYLPFAVLLTAFYHRYDRNIWASTTLHVFYNIVTYLLIRFVPAL